MVILLIVLLACAAALGITLAIQHFANKKMPLALALFHGLFAVAAVVALIAAVVQLSAARLLVVALIIFALAAAGGLTLFLGYYLPKKKLPSAIVIVHGLAAVAGFVVVVAYAVMH